jgi:hypothetical protein
VTIPTAAAWRRLLTGALAVALLAVAGRPARAQPMLAEEASRLRTPQHFALEMRFGPYRPDVDSEFAGRAPYREFFGDGNKLMMQLELDYQIFQKFGSAGIGFGIGYFAVTGKAFDGRGSGTRTADDSTLKIFPLSLSAVYRFDVLYEQRGIPLVPYAKLGLDYAIWQVTDGNGEIATDGVGGRARGGTLGWHGAVGVSLILDFIDPDAAKVFDSEMGVNHTHLFFELNHYDISGLGQSNRMHLGDNTWTMGLMFEF